ncbi:hypothetical protein [Litchfieldia salsa]|nr:hypothetical protein [Litchfieldia salsa]
MSKKLEEPGKIKSKTLEKIAKGELDDVEDLEDELEHFKRK